MKCALHVTHKSTEIMEESNNCHVASHLLYVALNETVAKAKGCCGKDVRYGWVQ